MTSILFPGAQQGTGSFKFRLARLVFTRSPYVISTILYVAWRSIVKRQGLDQFFDLRRSYRPLFVWLARIPLFADTAKLALNFAHVDSLICNTIEYGPNDPPPRSSENQLVAVQRILHHQEFHGHFAQARYRAAISSEALWEDDKKLQRAIDGFRTLGSEARAVTGGWMFYALRKLLLIKYHDGRGEQVPAIGQRSADLQAELRRTPPRPSAKLQALLDQHGLEYGDLKLMSPDWSALIGHMGHLDVHLRMKDMGWWSGSPLLVTYSGKIANRPFLSLLEERCPTAVLEEGLDHDVWVECCALTKYFGVSHQVWGGEGRPMGYWNDWGAAGLKAWSTLGLPYPMREAYDRRFQNGDETQTAMANLRRHFGMSESDWYVCLHMRDANTRGEKDGVGETVRNAGLTNYLETIRYVTAQGGWVIRMGGPSVPPLPEMPHVIDYARSQFRSPIMDLHLVRNAQYFIGTTSGFAYVATSFDVPTVMVNAISSVGLLWTDKTRFALKPVHTTSGRLLSQSELTSERWRWAFPTYESLAEAGLVLSQSSEDEILETVKEVEQIARGHIVRSPLADRWQECLRIPGFFGASLPSHHFLEKYQKEFLA